MAAIKHDIKSAGIAHKKMHKALPSLRQIKLALTTEAKKPVWEKQDWLLAWLIIEIHELRTRVGFKLKRLADKILPLKRNLIKGMSSEMFSSAHLLKRSME